MIGPLAARDLLAELRDEGGEDRRLQRIDAAVQHPLIACDPSGADQHEGQLLAASAAERRDIAEERIVAEALHVAEKSIVGGVRREHEPDAFAEPLPLVRAPMNGSRDVLPRVTAQVM